MKAILLSLLALSFFGLEFSPAYGKLNTEEITAKTAERQIRQLIEPLIEKYCHDECRLLGIKVQVGLAVQEDILPGFDDVELRGAKDLAPTDARVKLLIGDKVGPVSQQKLLDLLHQFLDNLDYPVTIDKQITHFPLPQGSEGKVAELRDRVTKQFTNTAEELIRQFCLGKCLLADFDLQTDVVNGEEAQYGNNGEFIQEGDTAIRIRNLSATLLMDESLLPEEQNNILEMLRLRTNSFRHVNLSGKSMKFPKADLNDVTSNGVYGRSGLGRGIAETNSERSEEKRQTSDKRTSSEKNSQESTSKSSQTSKSVDSSQKAENYSRVEKIERVESGDAVQAELQKFKVYGLVFACAVLALLIFIALTGFRSTSPTRMAQPQRMMETYPGEPSTDSSHVKIDPNETRIDRMGTLSKRYEIERLYEDLVNAFGQQPRVAKQVFGRILTEEGVEVTSEYIHIFGEGIVVELLRDPSLQGDINELMEYYARNPIQMTEDQKLELLRKLHSRTVSGKLVVMGNRSSNLFDFLAEMDGLQIMELIRTESITVKAIVLTQVDHQKRSAIYTQMDQEIRMQLLNELSRIDYLPRDYIFNVANALKRKRRDNPKLNTEALPGSDVLVGLLERTGQDLQKTVVKNLEISNPDSARTVKAKLVSMDTLRYLRDGQLLEVILSLKHEELIQFLKGAPDEIRKIIFVKSPKELVEELEEEIAHASVLSRETYQNVERKILNRIKVLANDGHINLIETNERMFSEGTPEPNVVQSTAAPAENEPTQAIAIKKVSGW
ncbi:MAG: hypothetical protein HYX41_05505 [Bdellovibrio sp.]|nr:hypothetical protein [Bdellovibrio sp.]